jgi:hypothetical protein
MGAWSVGFHALTLALGEPELTIIGPTPAIVGYGSGCGCQANTADGVGCVVTTCSRHESLFPAQTKLRPEKS